MKITPLYFLMQYILYNYFAKNYCTEVSSVASSSDGPVGNNIITVLDLKQIESIYIAHKLNNRKEDPVCSLSKLKKLALCEQIFQEISQYREKPIYLNKIAFLVNSVECEEKEINSVTTIFFIDDLLVQQMYPCYGRHNPVRTDYRIDDYYDKYYVSTGPHENTIFVYVHEYEPKFINDFYNLCSYHLNVRLADLADMVINITEVSLELQSNREIIVIKDVIEIENIYLRAYYQLELGNDICSWTIQKIVPLCKLIFNEYISKFLPHVILNEDGFVLFGTLCQKQELEIIFHGHWWSTLIIMQKMLPCFGQNRLNSEVSFYSEYYKYFYISGGPRENSVFIYTKKESANNEKFILFALIENIYVTEMNLSEIEGHSDSKATMFFIDRISSALNMRKQYLMEMFLIFEENLINILKIRKNLELAKYEKQKKKISNSRNQAVQILTSNMFNQIRSIIKYQQVFESERFAIKMKRASIVNYEKLLRENSRISRKLLKMDSKRNISYN